MLLEIKNLKKNYGGVKALDDVSFSLKAGAVLGLVGDNGAGKSTLMKCITGAEDIDHGVILFDGNALSHGDLYNSRFSGIEMIYQDLDLCLEQSVISNIFLGRESLIEIMGIKTPFLDKKGMQRSAKGLVGQLNADIDVRKKVGDLSGGQRQAVAIARALLFKPRLLIMDEPTAALGVREIAKVLGLIKSLKQQKIAVILISHRLGDIFEVADRIIMMRQGQIHEDRSITDISLTELTHKILDI